VTTLLAALRLGIEPPKTKIPIKVVQALLQSANVIKGTVPQPEPVKVFLESPRAQALAFLQNAWIESESFNELCLMPGIVCEGEWKNQPQETREFLFNLLEAVPDGKWWSLNAFIRDINKSMQTSNGLLVTMTHGSSNANRTVNTCAASHPGIKWMAL
jgi:hypothetical protein